MSEVATKSKKENCMNHNLFLCPSECVSNCPQYDNWLCTQCKLNETCQHNYDFECRKTSVFLIF